MHKYTTLSIEPCSSEKRIFVKGRLSPSTFSRIQKLSEKPWPIREKFVDTLHNVLKVPTDYSIVLVVRLKKSYSYCEIDFAWNERLLNLLQKHLHLETSMWNLSTVGGAFSSMGDFFDDFAQRAYRVSLRQRKIAMELDDPILISRCNVYIALSLAQLLYFSEAKQIIKTEYYTAKQLKSTFLLNCVKGTWAKIRHIYKNATKVQVAR